MNFQILLDVWLGVSSSLFDSYQTLVFQHSSPFLKHTSQQCHDTAIVNLAV